MFKAMRTAYKALRACRVQVALMEQTAQMGQMEQPAQRHGTDGTDGTAGAAGADGAAGAAGTQTHFVDGDPASTLGSDGDLAIDYTGGRILEKVSGTWTVRYTMGGTTAPDDHTRRVARSADATLTEAEVTAGESSMDNNVSLTAWGQGVEEYVFVGVPEDEGDITDIQINGSSVFATFQAYEDVDGNPIIVDGHKWWRTIALQDGEFAFAAEIIQ